MNEVDRWLEQATPDRRVVNVCLDRALVSRLLVARKELADLEVETVGVAGTKMLGNDRASELTATIAELEGAYQAASKAMVFEGLGWGPWRELVSEHPPAREQADVFAQAVAFGFMPHSIENIGWNAETFVPAAIAASCVDPDLSVAQAATILRKAPPGVLDRIWTAVLEVNWAGADDPFVPALSANGSAGVSPSTTK